MVQSPIGIRTLLECHNGRIHKHVHTCDTIPQPEQLFCRNGHSFARFQNPSSGPSPYAAQYLIYFGRRANNPSASNWVCHIKLNR
jgi:hypothetical protein